MKPSQQRSIVTKLTKCTHNCNVYVQHQSKRTNSSPQQCPTTSCRANNAAEIKRTGLCYFTLLTLLSRPLTDHHLFKHLDNFLQEKIFNNRVEAQNAFEEFIGSKTSEFDATGISKLASRWQKCIDSDFYFD